MASCCSEVLITWVTTLMWKGVKGRTIEDDDIPDLPAGVRCDMVGQAAVMNYEKGTSLRSLMGTLMKWDLFGWVILGIVQGVVNAVVKPLLLKFLIEAATDDKEDRVGEATIYLGALCAALIIEGLTSTKGRMSFAGRFATGTNIIVASLVHSKSLRLTGGSATTKERALIGNDMMRIYENTKILSQFPSSVASIIGGAIIILYTVKLPGLAGLGMLCLVLLANQLMARVAAKAEKSTLNAADHRILLMTRIIEGIKAIKLSAWEVPFTDAVFKARSEEIDAIKEFRLFSMSAVQVGRSAPTLASCITFAVMYASGQELVVSDIFAAFSVFQSMRLGLIVVPHCMSIIATMNVSLYRVEEYLDQPEAPPLVPVPSDSKYAVTMAGSFTHFGNEKFNLKVNNFRVNKGSTCGVVGPVGSGKSTMIQSILGDTNMLSGQVMLEEQIGYVPQKSFVICGTIEDNIVMGREMNESKFRDAVFRAALDEDLSRLPDGRHTELGERGVTLSGGQQQRVCIARALYGNPALLVMDDPLAAVDGQVARTIFKRVVMEKKSHQSIVMSLNQLQFLTFFDNAVYLDDGEVAEDGLIADLAAKADGKIALALKESAGVDLGGNEPDNEMAEPMPDIQKGNTAALIQKEHQNSGSVNQSVLRKYFKSMGTMRIAVCVVVLLLTYAGMAFNDRWLAVWAAQAEGDDSPAATPAERQDQKPDAWYLYVFIGSSLWFAIGLVLTSVCMSLAAVKAGLSLHNDCFTRVIHAPLSWFDSTPSGRILSRFSTDLANVDVQFANTLDNVVQLTMTVLVLLIVICVIVPLVVPVVVVSVICYGFLVVGVDKSNREVKRFANNAMSPVLSSLSEIGSPSGRLILRAMKLSDPMQKKFREEYDHLMKHSYASNGALHFGMLISYFISIIISTATGLLMLYGPQADDLKDSAAEFALAMTYSFMLPYFFLFYSMLFSMFKAILTSLERLLECLDDAVPQEPEWFTKEDEKVDANWPKKGKICFDKVSLVYRPGLPPAVKEADFTIRGGSTVGVVGRTGAGKSSLVVLLFRLVEAASGMITIDGVDISKIGLQTLRKAMAVIPQEPLLIDDTVARNLDPFKQKSDEELRIVLDKMGLTGCSLDDQGMSLSAGEKQLISLARALLLPAKVIVMDEPTSNIDPATDQAIQRVIREDWADKTVITIAHRLITIIDGDEIIVMDAGQVAEQGLPMTLMKDETTILHKMVQGLGQEMAARLEEKAATHIDNIQETSEASSAPTGTYKETHPLKLNSHGSLSTISVASEEEATL
eukprot:TRINITY_DN1159_c0_g4_i4.p1 TRINITY_DN1159_c0_g4~~TRINITY_DN1159_c0_g4_i4.p1  ORF type:complete len:1284 (+),score=386.26 TRINITY_DN1159_c0_g4_i4:69-3920(+)